MTYLLLIYQNPAAFQAMPEEDRTALMNEVDGIWQQLTASGEWVGGDGLADPATTRTVRMRDGVPVVTDGPYIEAKEYVAGYLIVDCATPERAEEIAARWPDARHWAMEVRAIVEPPGES